MSETGANLGVIQFNLHSAKLGEEKRSRCARGPVSVIRSRPLKGSLFNRRAHNIKTGESRFVIQQRWSKEDSCWVERWRFNWDIQSTDLIDCNWMSFTYKYRSSLWIRIMNTFIWSWEFLSFILFCTLFTSSIKIQSFFFLVLSFFQLFFISILLILFCWSWGSSHLFF